MRTRDGSFVVHRSGAHDQQRYGLIVRQLMGRDVSTTLTRTSPLAIRDDAPAEKPICRSGCCESREEKASYPPNAEAGPSTAAYASTC